MPDLEHIKQVPASTGIHELIANRWSPRAFADKPISNEDLRKIFTAASWAASASNEQPWRFLIGHKGDETYTKILDCLVEFNQNWAKSAPVLVLTLAKTTSSKDGSNNAWALHDTGAASANMCLQAIALGIHTHGMAGYDKDKVRTHFRLPAEYTEGAVWAMGYLGDPESLPDSMKKMELAPRERKSLSELVFTDFSTPGTPAKL
ncbi:nitroreductase family protein [Granulicella paludicola]|uniref:nitroreductase family protein n=1 Tax=Granulicella paludicola TaxID=474951 RepID=UPI0021DFE54D|nr:nitroreductase family protein [Granulicella paludicola]